MEIKGILLPLICLWAYFGRRTLTSTNAFFPEKSKSLIGEPTIPRGLLIPSSHSFWPRCGGSGVFEEGEMMG